MSMPSIKLTGSDVQNCNWTVVEVTPTYRRSVGRGTHPATGLPIEVSRTEFLAETELLTLNAEERNARDGKRWSAGAGSEKGGNVPMIRVGRIPINKFLADIAPKMREGDSDHIRWYLNRPENQPFRTKSGKL